MQIQRASLYKQLVRLTPAPVRRLAHRAHDFRPVRHALCDSRDALDWVFNRRAPLTPPRKLVHGIGSSLEVGHQFLGHFRDLADLKPTESVLDVGCGVGRMAIPLTGFLTPPGRYEGFDIVAANVRWCRRAVTPKFPHFHFTHADIHNREYNPRGRLRGEAFRFPYPDAGFDFALVTSVFTHLMPADAAHYLRELGRVPRPGGRVLGTFFLLNPESERHADTPAARFALLPRGAGDYRTTDAQTPEACVALDERQMRAASASAGLTWDTPRWGHWCGRPAWFDFQDIVVMRKG